MGTIENIVINPDTNYFYIDEQKKIWISLLYFSRFTMDAKAHIDETKIELASQNRNLT